MQTLFLGGLKRRMITRNGIWGTNYQLHISTFTDLKQEHIDFVQENLRLEEQDRYYIWRKIFRYLNEIFRSGLSEDPKTHIEEIYPLYCSFYLGKYSELSQEKKRGFLKRSNRIENTPNSKVKSARSTWSLMCFDGVWNRLKQKGMVLK